MTAGRRAGCVAAGVLTLFLFCVPAQADTPPPLNPFCHDVTADDAKAATLRDAAAVGDARAEYYVGHFYAYGRDDAPDMAKAAEYYRKSAEQGYAPAEFALGLLYDFGGAGEKDPAQAAEWYGKAAAQGSANAMSNLSLLYQKGSGVSQDAAQAKEWGARTALASFAAYDPVKRPFDAAYAAALQKNADSGDIPAQVELGMIYMQGAGVSRDYAKAVGLLTRAAAQGSAAAAYYLGMAFRYGAPELRDVPRALALLQKAAAKGYGAAATALGDQYSYGDGPKDEKKAFAAYSRAAALKDATGEFRTGQMLLDGVNGAPPDLENALLWLGKATRHQSEAQALGFFQSCDEAAAKLGYQKAKRILSTLENPPPDADDLR